MNTALFSGRFDPPNLGHTITIFRLLNEYDKVVIAPLDRDREGCDIKLCEAIFKTIFELIGCKRVYIIPNKTHFGKIMPKEIYDICECIGKKINDITYVGGNKKVNKHIKSLGIIKVKYIPRTILYNSTEIRKKMAQGESLENLYNLSKESVCSLKKS